MRIALPDVNVLIALHDPLHTGYDKAHEWFQNEGRHGWATCPLTENGFVRIVSQPFYDNGIETVSEAMSILTNMIAAHADGHTFWHDNISLLDPTLFQVTSTVTHKHLTDLYLLGLCERNGGTLTTLDARISVDSIITPKSDIVRIL